MKFPSVKLSSHFTYRNIFIQVLMPVLTMIFISIYGLVDGFFVANFDSADAFAGINLVFPIVMVVGGLSYMFASGGSALCGKLLGEKNNEYARKVFSMLVIVVFGLGIVVSIIGFHFVEPIVYAMAKNSCDADNNLMISKAIEYGKIIVLGQSIYMLQSVFQNFFVVDERPGLGFIFTLAAGITNIIFDALFVAIFKWGIQGAAIATIMGYCAGGIGPVIYFFINKKGLLYFEKTRLEFKPILKTITNGFSDFIFNISTSVVSIVYNIVLFKFFGKAGITAYGSVMYLSFVLISMFIGYAIGIGPVISYNYGAKNTIELKNVVKKSLIIVGIASAIMLTIGLTLARPLSMIFVDDPALLDLSTHALRMYSLSFAFAGFCIYATSHFTALNNGLVSGIISIFRTLIFQICVVFILSSIFGGEGIWWSAFAAESLSFVLASILFLANKKKYSY